MSTTEAENQLLASTNISLQRAIEKQRSSSQLAFANLAKLQQTLIEENEKLKAANDARTIIAQRQLFSRNEINNLRAENKTLRNALKKLLVPSF